MSDRLGKVNLDEHGYRRVPLGRGRYLTLDYEVARMGAPAKWYLRRSGIVIAGPFKTKREAAEWGSRDLFRRFEESMK